MSDESSTAKQLAANIQPRGWGVVSGTLWTFVAFIGPQFLISILVPLVQNLDIGSDSKLFVLEGLTEAVIFAIIWSVIKLYGLSLRDIGFYAKPTINDLGLVVLSFPLYIITSAVLLAALGRLFPQINSMAQQVGFQQSQPLEMLLVFVALVLIPPFVEETVFRGFLFRAYRRQFGLVWAMVGVSLLFAAAHTPISVSIDVFALSRYLCYLRERTDSLWPSIMLHSLKNLVAFVFLFIIPTR